MHTLNQPALRRFLPLGASIIHPDVMESAIPAAVPTDVRATLHACYHRLDELEGQVNSIGKNYSTTIQWFLMRTKEDQYGVRRCGACGVDLQDVATVGHESGCPLHFLTAQGEMPDVVSIIQRGEGERLDRLLKQAETDRLRAQEDRAVLMHLVEDYAGKVEAAFNRPVHPFNGTGDVCGICGAPEAHLLHLPGPAAELAITREQNQAADATGTIDLTHYKGTDRLLRWVQSGAYIVLRELNRQRQLSVAEIQASLAIYHDRTATMDDAFSILELLGASGLAKVEVDPDHPGDLYSPTVFNPKDHTSLHSKIKARPSD